MSSNENLFFGDLLSQQRTQARMSQQALAKSIGVHRNTIAAWEKNGYRPENRELVIKIAKFFKFSDVDTNMFLKAAKFEPLAEIWTVPYPRDPLFTGREELLQTLQSKLVLGVTAAFTQAISGLGGIGKTHTAVEFAYRVRQDYLAVLWLQADSQEVLLLQCRQLVSKLRLPEQHEPNQTKVVEVVKHWLETHTRWLLILDNIEDFTVVKNFVPPGHQGCVLLTTRAQVTYPFAESFELPIMTEQEGILFLLYRTQLLQSGTLLSQASPEHYDDAKQIWQLMDGLPLALDQAGAYILETGCSLRSYIQIYMHKRADLLSRRGMENFGHPYSVATTFQLCFEKVAQRNQIAPDILRACAFVHADAIPEELLQQGISDLNSNLTIVINDPSAWNDVLAALRAYSLIERNAKERTLTIHRLVQAVLKDSMIAESREVYDLWQKHIISAIYNMLSEDPHSYTSWPSYERLTAHALACSLPVLDALEEIEARILETTDEEAGSAEIAFETVLSVLIYLREVGDHDQMEAIYTRLKLFSQKIYQGDVSKIVYFVEAALHADKGDFQLASSLLEQALQNRQILLDETAIRDRHDLAMVYMYQKKYQQAEPLMEQALNLSRQYFGANDKTTLFISCDLGSIYGRQNKFEQGRSLVEPSLGLLQQQFGLSHPAIIQPLCNMAELYCAQEKYDQAESLLQQALEIAKRTLGKKHHDIIDILLNLFEVYISWGKYDQAESHLQMALLHQTKFKGKQKNARIADAFGRLGQTYLQKGMHLQAETILKEALELFQNASYVQPLDMARTLNNLGYVYIESNPIKAEDFVMQALQIRKQHLGDKHTDVARSLDSLATIYFRQKKYDLAEPLALQALEINQQTLGKEHSITMLYFDKLIDIYIAQEKYQQIEDLYQYTLQEKQQQFGSQSAQTTNILIQLANLYITQKKDKEAEPLYKQICSIQQQQLGEEHTTTVAWLYGLARIYYRQRNYEQAEPLFQQVLVAYRKQSENDYSSIRNCLTYLGHIFYNQELYEQAEPYYREALSLDQQNLNSTNFNATLSLSNLVEVYLELGKYEQAEPLLQQALTLYRLQQAPETLKIAQCHMNLGRAYIGQEKYEQAELSVQQALLIFEQQLGPEDSETILGRHFLAFTFWKQRNYKQAEILYEQTFVIAQKRWGFHSSTLRILEDYVLLLKESGKDKQAKALEAYAQQFQAALFQK